MCFIHLITKKYHFLSLPVTCNKHRSKSHSFCNTYLLDRVQVRFLPYFPSIMTMVDWVRWLKGAESVEYFPLVTMYDNGS